MIFNFHRNSDDFTDILTDTQFKNKIVSTVKFPRYLIITLKNDIPDSIFTYITLKYGDDLVDEMVPDRKPIMYKDYTPKKH